jgi:hypothetical protein
MTAAANSKPVPKGIPRISPLHVAGASHAILMILSAH